ncbi:MAG: hypothetical protein ACK5D0_06010 [Burkholderiaceae bacterium]|jgi:hypothetical protein
MRTLYFITSITLITLLSGCAGYSPSRDIVGQDRTALLASMGQPEREYEVDGISVLHYPRGPAGSHTYFVYLGKDGRVVKSEQVLTEERFNRIRSGMTKDQVIGVLGVTRITMGLARQRGYVWFYRYENVSCKSFIIEFAPDDIVRSTYYRMSMGRRCKHVGG